MFRFSKIVENVFKIKNFEPFIFKYIQEEYKILGLPFPSSRMECLPTKNVIYEKKIYEDFKCHSCNTGFKPLKSKLCKVVNVNDNKLTKIEKIIGLDIPDSRFKN